MKQDSALSVLLAHLEEERRCLDALAEQLELEADAARRMDLDTLVELSRSKSSCVDMSLKLARERPAKLQACRPQNPNITMTELLAQLTGDDQQSLAALRSSLQTLSRAVLASAEKAAVRNETGLSILTGALNSGRLIKSKNSLTYSPKGKIHTGVQFLHGDGRNR